MAYDQTTSQGRRRLAYPKGDAEQWPLAARAPLIIASAVLSWVLLISIAKLLLRIGGY